MSRYLKVLAEFMRFSFKDDVTYRLDFTMKLIKEFAWLVVYLVFFDILFLYVDSFGGWSKMEIILLYGTYRIVQQTIFAFARNLWLFHYILERGELDFFLLKPIDAQFVSSFGTTRTASFINIFVNIVIVLYSAGKLGIAPSIFTILLYILLVASSSIILYSLFISAVTLNFYFTRLNNIPFLFHQIEAIGRIPITALNRYAQILFATIIPIVFLATVPAGILLGRSMGLLVPGSFLVAGVTLFLSRRFWLIAIKNYTSAGG